jgi:hypothetical protein
VRQAALQS